MLCTLCRVATFAPCAQIHGTCLGFQLLHILASNVSRNDLLVETDSVAHASTLEFLPGAESSYMFGSMSTELRAKLSNPTQNIALENHECGESGVGMVGMGEDVECRHGKLRDVRPREHRHQQRVNLGGAIGCEVAVPECVLDCSVVSSTPRTEHA